MVEDSKHFDMSGKPVRPEKENGTGKPGWDRRTKKETAISNQGMALLRDLAGKCIDYIEKHSDDEDAVQKFLDAKEKEWIRKAGDLNYQLTRLNEGHVGYRHGRNPECFVPKALEMLLTSALSSSGPEGPEI